MTNAPRRLKNGLRFGDWELGKAIGAGGQGEVWEARSQNTKHAPPRAIKICFADDPVARARFEDEVRLLQQLQHNGIPPILDSDLSWTLEPKTNLACSYYVSERFEHTIADLPWIHTPHFAIYIFNQLCDILEYLHSQTPAIIHRDLKPSNILLGSEPWRVVLADFGIARTNNEDRVPLTRTHEVVGSTFYRAPEVLMGIPATPRSDLYSLGRTLEWLLTGREPIETQPRSTPAGSGLSDGARRAIDTALRRACAFDPEHRFSAVHEFRQAIPVLHIVTAEELAPSTRSASQSTEEIDPSAPDSIDPRSTEYSRAIEVLRSRDAIGWRELNKRDRSQMHEALSSWQRDNQYQNPTAYQQFSALMDDILVRTSTPLAHVMAASEFSPDALKDTTRLIHDILHVPGWQLSGSIPVIYAPRSLVYVAHHLFGAAAASAERPELAIGIARTVIPGDSKESQELWRHHDLVGWPKTLGGNATEAWKYLFGLADNHSWLVPIFNSTYDYQLALVSYAWVLNFIDFIASYKSGLLNSAVNIDHIRIDVPPVFLGSPQELVQTSFRRIFTDGQTTDRMAIALEVDAATARQHWSSWIALTRAIHQKFTRGFSTILYNDEQFRLPK